MSDTEEMHERGRKIRSLLDREMPTLETVEIEGVESPIWHVSNLLAHVLQDAEPLCFSGKITNAESGELEFALLTEDIAIHATGRPIGQELKLSIVPRSSLQSLDVLSAPAELMGEPSTPRLTGVYRFTYTGGVTFTLPLNARRRMNSQVKLEELLPELLKDLRTS